MATQARYMVGQRLSDYQVEKILRHFADGYMASDAVDLLRSGRKPHIAPNTVFRIYDLTRIRLLTLGYYPEPTRYLEWSRSPEVAFWHSFSQTARLIEEHSYRLRGTSDESVRYHLADLIFRAEKHDTLTTDAFFQDIKLAVKITGPLNREPVNREVWYERNHIQALQRLIDLHRRRPLGGVQANRQAISDIESQIAAAQRRLRNLRRSPNDGTA